MRKILIFLISLTIIFSIFFFILKDKLDINKILKKIEKNTSIKIKLEDNQKWSYYPNLLYQNKLSASNSIDDLIIEKGIINISREYNINSPFIIDYQSPSIRYKGINFKNTLIKSEYKNRIINLKNFSANVIEGNINLNGQFFIDNDKKI